MKFNNPLVCLDLETTNCENHAIIEIGAVIISKSIEKTSFKFRQLVFPDFPLSEFVLELTGYSRQELLFSPLFPDVAKAFEDWVKSYIPNISNARLMAWGNYFDINVLRNQYKRHNLEYPFNGTVIDVKSIAMAYLVLSGQRTDSFSVQKMAELLNIDTSKLAGKYHNALFDASVTADVFLECIWRIKRGVWIDKQYIKVGI